MTILAYHKLNETVNERLDATTSQCCNYPRQGRHMTSCTGYRGSTENYLKINICERLNLNTTEIMNKLKSQML